MSYVRMLAVHDDDEKETLVLVGRQDEKMCFFTHEEAFGYVKDFDDDDSKYYKYPFILYYIEDNDAQLDWGAFDNCLDVIDIMQRPVVNGTKIVRTQGKDRWMYTVKSIHNLQDK